MEEKIGTIGQEIELFTKHADSIGNVLIGLVIALQDASKKSKESLSKFVEEKCEVVDSEGKKTISIPNKHIRRWNMLSKHREHLDLARTLLPRSLLVSLVSQHDAYLGRILRVVFLRRPGILNVSDRKLSFENLTQFKSIEEAREYIIEKEIESILRSSHAEQFKWMEKTFDLTLTKGLESWPIFIEITERRNLFVHTDGVVSSQYLIVCRQHKCNIDEKISDGARLGVPQKYFESSYECIYEIGVKLGHVLWRKLFPDEYDAADSALIKTTFELIDSGKYRLACNLLDFVCSGFKRFSNESNQLILTVNRAQAYKWLGNEERCKQIMREIDWSAKGDEFKLADSVLASNWDNASKVMKRIGRDGSVSQQNYREWPLFKEWRKEDRFLTAYENLFGEPFVIKTATKPLESVSQQEETVVDESREENISLA